MTYRSHYVHLVVFLGLLACRSGESSAGMDSQGGGGGADEAAAGSGGADTAGAGGSVNNAGGAAQGGVAGTIGSGGAAGGAISMAGGSGGAVAGTGGNASVGGAGGGRFTVYTAWPFDSAEAARRQTETAAAIGLTPEFDIDLGGGVKLTMVLIPAGRSTLGCTNVPFPGVPNASDRCEGDEPLRTYVQTKPLYIGKTVVTLAHYNALAPSMPLAGAPGIPARLSYRRTQDIIRPAVQAHAPNGWTIRLPTVDEWEYAARAGVVTYFSTGDTEADLAQTAWYKGNSGNTLHEVGLKTPNAWNMYDVIGNAWAWIWVGSNVNGYGDASTTIHLVRSCPYNGAPLWNECRLSNRMVSDKSEVFRFVADVPLQ